MPRIRRDTRRAGAGWAVLLCSLLSLGRAWALPIAADCRSERGEFGLGRIQFPNSGAPGAQKDFLRGVSLLYSFEYGDARRAFQAAERLDPGFAMAYWGEALTYDQTLWAEEDVRAARAVLARLAPSPAQRAAKAVTARERAYLVSVEQLFGAGDKTQRDARYSTALAALVQKYPDDLNARTFHALSILGLTNGVRDVRNYMRAAAEAEEVLQVEPCQPGALHYLIHATDDPVHAILGLQAARRLAEVAPAAEHAIHMSSHIYVALGMWDDVIRANVASIRVARADDLTGYHQMMFLIYGYLQENKPEEAEKWIRLVAREAAARPSAGTAPGGRSSVELANVPGGSIKDARARLAYGRAMWLVETRGAVGADARVPVDSHGIASILYFAGQDFARGITAGADIKEARAALAQLDARIAAERAAPRVVGSDWLDTVSDEQLSEAAVMADALEGVVQYDEGRRAAGIERVARAAADADRLPAEYGPPWSVKPLDELLGELLLADGRRPEAVAAFEKSLAAYPNRRLTVEDLAAARGTR